MSAHRSHYDYMAMTPGELARVDPVETNLVVAKSIPGLGHLDIPYYQGLRDEWAQGVRRRLPHAERVFAQSPGEWENDVNFIRLAVLCEHLDCEVGVAYNEEQKNEQRYGSKFSYTNPSDLFLNGVMDTKRGTCANMAMLHVAVAWRLGWPVSLACVGSHHMARFDDGRVRYNVEATETGQGGFATPTDEQVIHKYRLSRKAITSGSDLRALPPRELLGLFIGLRARYMKDIGNDDEAERDYLLARHLFPAQRGLYMGSTWVSVRQSQERFERGEEGSPQDLASQLSAAYGEPVRQSSSGEQPASGGTVIANGGRYGGAIIIGMH